MERVVVGGIALTTPQRNCLLEVFRSHPGVYEVRGSAPVARRLVAVGLVIQLSPTPKTRRFRLTAAGLARATRLAARREADHQVVMPASTATSAVARSIRSGVPAEWPFPASAHAWDSMVQSPAGGSA